MTQPSRTLPQQPSSLTVHTDDDDDDINHHNANEPLILNESKKSKRKRRKQQYQQQSDTTNENDTEEQMLTASLFGTTAPLPPAPAAARVAETVNSKTKKPPPPLLPTEEYTFTMDRMGVVVDVSTAAAAAAIVAAVVDTTIDGFDNDNDTEDEHNNHNDTKSLPNNNNNKPSTTNTTTSTTANRAITKKAAWVDDDDDDEDMDEGTITTTTSTTAVNMIHQSDRIRKLRTNPMEHTILNRNIYQERLRQRFIQSTQPSHTQNWATVSKKGNDDVGEEEGGRFNDKVSTTTSSSLMGDDGDDENGRRQRRRVRTTTTTTTLPPPHQIQMKRCPDINQEEPNQSVCKIVQFHPLLSSPALQPPPQPQNSNSNDTAPLLLFTAGLDKTLRFFHCQEEKSTKLHGVHFPNFPIHSASFIGNNSSNVVVTGRRPFLYIYDIAADKVQQIAQIPHRTEKSWERCVVPPPPSDSGGSHHHHHHNNTIALLGNDGYILLYNIQQQKCCTTQPMKLNGSVRTVSFTNQGNELLASGSDGDIYRYDLRYNNNNKCIERFHNDDGTITSHIASSQRTFAVGAESGVVNIYAEQSTFVSTSIEQQQQQRGVSITTPFQQQQQRTPIKSIMNIKTSIDAMTYNHDGNLLAIASRREKDCMKLVHVPTGTVYSNWPTSNTPLGYVYSIDFSPYSQYMAIGNDQGKCLLYKLMHYE